jgi:hypothetical protein
MADPAREWHKPVVVEVTDYAGLMDALRARRDQLAVTHQTIDDVAGLPSGYTGKLFAPHPMKCLGMISLGAILGTLGLKLAILEDDEALKRVKGRLVPRKKARAGEGRPKPEPRKPRQQAPAPTAPSGPVGHLVDKHESASGALAKFRAAQRSRRALAATREQAAKDAPLAVCDPEPVL